MQTPEEMNALANKAKNDPNALLLLWQGCSRYAYKVTTIYQQAAALNGAKEERCGCYQLCQDGCGS